jgi:hypothetical protein
MNRRIVYSDRNNGVSICTPSDEVIAWMGCGGFWNNHPRGFMDVQIDRQISSGIHRDVARRFARAIQFGGCTTAEALEILRDRDCRDGTAHEVWDVSDIPTDRWFRDAWRRSHNGGPISIDLEKARPIQWRRLKDAATERLKDLYQPEINIEPLRGRILRARDAEELRRIWL